MNRFLHRSRGMELIDAPGIPDDDWALCLAELNTINRLLGGHATTLRGVRALLDPAATRITIVEIGCGGGDNLMAIHHWNKSRHLPLCLIGIDRDAACTKVAEKRFSEIPEARFIEADYRDTDLKGMEPDLVFCSLFCHHFREDQLTDLFRLLHTSARLGFFINDLQRHPVAYYAIKWLTAACSRSYLIKHDAPVSVLRGFVKKELAQLLRAAGVNDFSIRWTWAFRYLVTVKNG